VDTFADDRGPLASINFVTAHDGLTLADLTAYNAKHNQGNGEDNRDGTDNNRSWNHGFEGPTEDDAVLTARQRSIRNLLGTLLFSAGVPMLLAGDEFGRTQRGNNNPYSQDNDVSWVDWQLLPGQNDLLETTRYLLALRRRFPAVRPSRFFNGMAPAAAAAGALKDLAWFAPDGSEMAGRHWEDGGLRTLQVLFADPPADPPLKPPAGSLLMVIAGSARREEILLPRAASITAYELLWDSAEARPPTSRSRRLKPLAKVTLAADSVRLYRAT
jgi:pullulanase/glycogen debranching enzyme